LLTPYLVTIGLAAHLGIFPWIYGDSRNAPPSNEDIARLAVAALMDPGRHAGKTYRPTGPELLGARGHGQGNRPRRRTIGQCRADARLAVHEDRADWWAFRSIS